MTDFDRAFEITFGVEKGYVNDPRDPGGETKFGISKRTYPHLDIANLTIETAKELLRRDYWDAARCDELRWPLNALLFDAAVHHSVATAVVLLQRAAEATQDGIMGRRTVAAANALDQRELGAMFMARRAIHLNGVRNFDKYGRGWLKRLFLVYGEAA